MGKNIPLYGKSSSKGFFVLLFLIMVSLVGFTQGFTNYTTSELANPFARQELNSTSHIQCTSHHVGQLILYDKAVPINSMQ